MPTRRGGCECDPLEKANGRGRGREVFSGGIIVVSTKIGGQFRFLSLQRSVFIRRSLFRSGV